MKKLLFIVLLFPFLIACNDDDLNDNQKEQLLDIATVDNPDQKTDFYFLTDKKERMWVKSSALAYYRPKDGQRIVVNYSILADAPQSSTYKYTVRVNDVYEVLTKGIFNITPATQDSIGNDKISIGDIWVGGDYLNVEFVYPGYNRTHFINLVSDASKTYTDGKVHLEFRHNDNGDAPTYNQWGMASFNIRSLRQTPGNKVELVIHTNEFSGGNTTYQLTYDYTTSSASVAPKQIKLQGDRGISR